MATERSSPSTRPGSVGETGLGLDAANGHQPLEVKKELPEPGEIVSETPAHSQEGPLDFSVKRRSVGLSESLTDDSQASSANSSPTPHLRLLGGSSSPAGLDEQFPGNYRMKVCASPPHRGLSDLDFGGLKSRGREVEQPSPHLQLPPSHMAAAAYLGAALPTNGAKVGAAAAYANLGSFMDQRRTQGTSSTKSTRPFKAYVRDQTLPMGMGLYNMHGMMPFGAIDPSVLQSLSISSDELLKIYREQMYILRERDKHIVAMARTSSMINGSSPRTTSGGSSSSNSSGIHSNSGGAPGNNTTSSAATASSPGSKPPSPPQQQQQQEQKPLQEHTEEHETSLASSPPTNPSSEPPVHPSPLAASHRPMPPPLTPTTPSTPTTPTSKGTPPLSSPLAEVSKGTTPSMVPPASSASATLVSSTSCSGNARKRPRTLPDEHKDEAYWERRRKNNEAAKRSRDARRAKEDEIAIRAALLEQENLKLRVEVAALKSETARLRCMLYNS